MKKLIYFILFVLLASFNIYSQVPEKLNYQAAVRNVSGEIIANQSVDMRISIIDSIMGGDVLYRETQTKTTNDYGVVNIAIGDGASDIGDFSLIKWGVNSKYLKIEVNIGAGLVDMGTVQLLSVPYALYASSAANLGDEKVYSTSTDTLFVVKDNAGNAVFAVFPDGAQVFVDESAKGKVGGFAVSGRNPNKAEPLDIFKVTPDSTRVFVNPITAKGKVGGFAVSGRNPNKALGDNYLVITPDSTRIFTQDTIKGFGVKDNSSGNSSSYLQLSPLNYFIGHRAGESITDGRYNTFIGYETGLNSTWGNGNLFLGFNAGRGNIDGALNVFIGNGVGYNFTGVDDGEENIFIGNDAGYNCVTTANSIFIGTRSGYYCGASYGNTFIGDRTASFGVAGDNNTILGSAAGFRIAGSENVFIGAFAGNATTSGNLNTYIGYQAGSSSTGKRNVFIGASAGAGETGSNKLYIANSADTSLITGDFTAQEVFIDGDLTATTVLPSDINLKTNLIGIQSGLKLLSTLSAYYFNWNDIANKEYNYSKEEQQIGIIAQDVEKVFPQMVVTSSKGFKAVDYTKFSPIIIEAIKEQQQMIEKQEDLIKMQQKQINMLIKEVENLKK